MRIKLVFLAINIILMNNNLHAQTGTLTDARDGKNYRTIQIGSQTWMAQNLAYAPSYYLYLNNTTATGIYCYNDDTTLLAKHGALYTWKLAQEVCPSGWHLPSKAEFEILLTTIGGNKKRAYTALIIGGDSGFEGMFSGWLYLSYGQSGRFLSMDSNGFFWSSSERKAKRYIYANILGLYKFLHIGGINSKLKKSALSVRCIKS